MILDSWRKYYIFVTSKTKRFYLIGSNNTQTRFRVLKIDRTEPKELILVDDKVEYNKQEIHQLLNMIGFGNCSSRTGRFNKLVSAFGIVEVNQSGYSKVRWFYIALLIVSVVLICSSS